MILHNSDTKIQKLKKQNKANNNKKTNKYKNHSEFCFDRSCNDHVTWIKEDDWLLQRVTAGVAGG